MGYGEMFKTQVFDSLSKGGGEKIKRTLRATSGVLLILMLASGVQAATVVFGTIGFMRGTETRMFPFDIIEGGHFKAKLTDFKFPAEPHTFSANVLGVVGGESDLSLLRLLDLIIARLKVSDEPMPAAAVLILVGLIGLIALKGRRK